MPSRVTLYAGPATDAALSFYPTEGALPVAFELADGYRIDAGFTGVRMIFGGPGSLGMSIGDAISRRILWPVPPDPKA
jgi:hypothetical protein